MKKLSCFIAFVLLVSCGPMHKYAKYNEYSRADINNNYSMKDQYYAIMIKNKKVDFILYLSHNYDLAKNNRQFRRLKKSSGSPKIEDLEDVLVGGFTTKSHLEYFPEGPNEVFYILLNPKKEPVFDTNYYTTRDTIIDGNIIKLIFTKSVGREESMQFIFDNMHINYGRPEVDMKSMFYKE